MARRYAVGWLAEFTGTIPFTVETNAIGEEAVPARVCFTCFGVAVPHVFIKAAKKGDSLGGTFFNYAAAEQDPRTLMAPTAGPPRRAITVAVKRTFPDCDPGIVEEICFADDPSAAWLVLADWLEERGDDRGRWIRSHQLDRARRWTHLDFAVGCLIVTSTESTN